MSQDVPCCLLPREWDLHIIVEIDGCGRSASPKWSAAGANDFLGRMK